MDCDIPSVMLEWQEIKIHVARKVAIDSAMSYIDLWQRIILEDQDDFRNIMKVIKIVLLIQVHTSECERGLSLMARVKTDWRANFSTPRLNDLMCVKLCDTTQYLPHPNEDVLELTPQSNFDVLQSWFKCNYLSVNESKNKVLSLGDKPPYFQFFADR